MSEEFGEEMVGLAEAAALLMLPYQDTHRLLLTGRLRGEKRGARWFVLMEDVKRLQERTKVPAVFNVRTARGMVRREHGK